MHGLWTLGLWGVAMLAAGAWQLFAPIDVLWARRDRALMARGQSPQRSAAWESSARNTGGVLLVGGLIFLLATLAVRPSAPQPMSGVSINGHELTQKEWDDCGHDMIGCTSTYMNTH